MAGSGPATCTSMGAGAPKFSTWLTMSAGRKEKVEPGKLCGNTVRKRLHIIGGGRMILVEADQDVAILRPQRAGVDDRVPVVLRPAGRYCRRSSPADRAESPGGCGSRHDRTTPRFPRCACRPARGHAAKLRQHPLRERNSHPGTAPARRETSTKADEAHREPEPPFHRKSEIATIADRGSSRSAVSKPCWKRTRGFLG